MIGDSLRNTAALILAMLVVGLIERFLPAKKNRAPAETHLHPNIALTLLTLLTYAALGALTLIALERQSAFRVLAPLDPPPAVEAVIIFLALDLAAYAAHRAMHIVPALWRVHRVHHTDPHVDVTTAFRQHPLESLWRALFMFATATIFGAGAGIYLIYRAFSAAFAIVEHANLDLGRLFDRIISMVFVTPNFHKLHHSRTQRETDTNYGNIFSVFDRAFGSLSPPKTPAEIVYGLDDASVGDKLRLGDLLRLR